MVIRSSSWTTSRFRSLSMGEWWRRCASFRPSPVPGPFPKCSFIPSWRARWRPTPVSTRATSIVRCSRIGHAEGRRGRTYKAARLTEARDAPMPRYRGGAADAAGSRRWARPFGPRHGSCSRSRARTRHPRPQGGNMLWTIIAILFALWLLGLIAHVGGGLIHLLLVVALVVFVVNLLTGRRIVV